MREVWTVGDSATETHSNADVDKLEGIFRGEGEEMTCVEGMLVRVFLEEKTSHVCRQNSNASRGATRN